MSRLEYFSYRQKITVFTTRADTLMGVTYVTLAPEHPLVDKVTSDELKAEVDAYIEETSNRSDLDRTSAKEKTGVFTGGYATHPISGDKVPIWIGDYVLGSYGTGAVMAVPAHDVRDFEFAEKYGLDMKWVVEPKKGELSKEEAFTEPGVAVNSGEFDGIATAKCKKAVTKKLKAMEKGGPKITYKLRDWTFSRQRYWGEPIPIYFPIDFPEGVSPTNANPREDDCEHTIRFECTVTAKKRAQAPEGHFFVNVDYKGVKLKDIPIKIPDGIVNKDKIGVEIRFPEDYDPSATGGGGVGGRGPNGRRRQR